MKPAAAAVLLGVAVLAAGPALAGAQELSEPAAATPDRRSVVLLREDCRSEIGRVEITLFANGTVRLRRGLGEEEQMLLTELGPDELDAYRSRLLAEDLGETDRRANGFGGDWIDRCRLAVADEDGQIEIFEYLPFDSRSLALSRVVGVVRELQAIAEERSPRSRLPIGYRADLGDVLRRFDGLLFEVIGFTADGAGVELQGLDQPFTVYVGQDNLVAVFEELVSAGGGE